MSRTETSQNDQQPRWPVVQPRRQPTGKVLGFPECGDWTCDDDEDWDAVSPTDKEYPSVKREYEIVRYHQPQVEWRQRLQRERDRLNGGRPLWHRF